MNNNEIYGNQAGLNSFMTKMYGFMAGAVAISAVTAYLISNVYQVQALTFLLIIVGLYGEFWFCKLF